MPEPVNVFYEDWGVLLAVGLAGFNDRPHRPPANCI